MPSIAVRISTGVVLVMTVLVCLITRTPPRPVARLATQPAAAVRILQFYANTGVLTRGDHALLCYGVENARSVRISPMAEAITPERSRCIEVAPRHTTHYALVAEGFDGRVAAQSLTLAVSAPEPDGRNLQMAGEAKGARRRATPAPRPPAFGRRLTIGVLI